jgi:type I restriction enzyme S subunit
MFGDPVLNPRKLKKEKIKKFGKIVTGNTPPRAEDKYYDNNFIEWVKTDNLFDDQLFATEAKEYLSEEGLRVGRKVKAGSLLVTCIAGSVKSIGTSCLVDRAVSFNQQINAIEPYEGIDSYFLYQLFKVSKLYVQNQAGKGMKKIITKSTFEDILFPMPDKDSQKRFGEIFQNVYNLRIIYQNSLTELNNLFGSIAQKAFKGELNVSKIELIQKEQEEITMSIKLDGYRLLEEIKKGDFEASKYVNEHQNYDAIKDMIFKLIEDGKISQKFDDNSKKIILEAE